VVVITEEEEWGEASAVVAMSSAGVAGLDPLEAEAVSVAVAFTQQPRRSVARADPLEWERAEAELDSVWVGTHHISQRRRHLSAQLQADRQIRRRALIRPGRL